MNATTNEVLICCKFCATSCAPWLSHCRKCGNSMNNQAQNPAWSDGQANRELLDSLDAIGGAGSDLADQEVFKMLDEIEKLTQEKVRASHLLQGTGQAIEPKLNPGPSAAKSALLAEQFKDLPEFTEANEVAKIAPRASAKPSAGQSVIGEAVFKQEFSPEPSFPSSDSNLSAFEAMANPVLVRQGQDTQLPASGIAQQDAVSLADSSSKQRRQVEDASNSQGSQAPEFNESREIATAEKVLDLGNKKAVDPEKFLPPDFFDPRDRKPQKKWGRWVALALLIGGMTVLAGYLVMKTYKDSLPAAVRGIGDLTKPATK